MAGEADDFDEETTNNYLPTFFDNEAPYFSVALYVEDVPEGEDHYVGAIRCQTAPRPGEMITLYTYGPESPGKDLSVDFRVVSIQHLAYNMSFAGPNAQLDWTSKATAVHATVEVIEGTENYLDFDVLLAWRKMWADRGGVPF